MRPTRIRILHVEDNVGDVRLMREILAEEASSPEFEIVQVRRLAEAIERLSREHFDAVLLDLSLPDASGVETVYRTCTAVPHVPIVVLTGFDDEALAIRAVQGGAQDYLIKGRLDPASSMRSIRYAIERHRNQMELRSQSLRDDLTGLYNRRGFLLIAEQQLRSAQRDLADLLLVFADVDGLKEINDTYGHQEGDRALIATAKILRDTLRECDLVARLGGDEFTVLAVDTNGSGADTIMARLRKNLDAYNARTDRPYRLDLSVGVARTKPDHGHSVHALMAEADRALYREKRNRAGARRPPAKSRHAETA